MPIEIRFLNMDNNPKLLHPGSAWSETSDGSGPDDLPPGEAATLLRCRIRSYGFGIRVKV